MQRQRDIERNKKNKSVVRHERREKEREGKCTPNHRLLRRERENEKLSGVDWLPVSCFARRVMLVFHRRRHYNSIQRAADDIHTKCI